MMPFLLSEGWKVTLLESMNKRCVFLEHAISATGLSNVQVVRGRAEVLPSYCFFNLKLLPTWDVILDFAILLFLLLHILDFRFCYNLLLTNFLMCGPEFSITRPTHAQKLVNGVATMFEHKMSYSGIMLTHFEIHILIEKCWIYMFNISKFNSLFSIEVQLWLDT